MKKSILIDSNIHQQLKMYVVKNDLVLSKFVEKTIKHAIDLAEIEEQIKIEEIKLKVKKHLEEIRENGN